MKARHMLMSCCLAALVGCASPAKSPPTLADYEPIDLSHPFNSQTLYWPTSPTNFALQSLFDGQTPGGWHYSANSICTPEHGGTHLDAPIHFAAGGQTADQVPLERLIGPAVVIDIAAKAAANVDYLLSVDDVTQFEKSHGAIAPGTIVLVRTGWDARWPDRKSYFGDDTPGDASNLHFPSFGPEAARLLVEQRKVAAIGIDVASIDNGASRDFQVHRVAAAANVPGFENLAHLDRLPPTGAMVVALPMKIEGGSGGPLRAVALVPRPSR
ncbi:MAG TPA: cyclase family protein [Candidatus Eisenbacteria bacterium]